MISTFAWGRWEEQWPNGRFRCVFVEAAPDSDGMIRATGLYRAAHGDSFDDIDTYKNLIAERTAVTIDGNDGLLVREESAELLATLPSLLRAVSKRLNLSGSRHDHRRAS